MSTLEINFLTGELGYRLTHSSIKKELLAKAIGIKGNYHPSVIDATAGLGRDAFLLAYLGCNVIALERSPIIAEQLQTALQHALQNPKLTKPISLSFINADAKNYLTTLKITEQPEVIYLDPMYPERSKSALVKQEMRLLRDIVGDDYDSAELLEIALTRALKRVVVKRPRLAPTLTALKPDFVIAGKSQRFDVYRM